MTGVARSTPAGKKIQLHGCSNDSQREAGLSVGRRLLPDHLQQEQPNFRGTKGARGELPGGESYLPRPGNSGERHDRGALHTSSSPRVAGAEHTAAVRAAQRWRCGVSMWNATRSPGCQRPADDAVAIFLQASCRGYRRAGSLPETTFACCVMKVRGMYQVPSLDPATNSSVLSRGTGSTGIQKLTFLPPVDVVVRLVLMPGRRLPGASFSSTNR